MFQARERDSKDFCVICKLQSSKAVQPPNSLLQQNLQFKGGRCALCLVCMVIASVQCKPVLNGAISAKANAAISRKCLRHLSQDGRDGRRIGATYPRWVI